MKKRSIKNAGVFSVVLVISCMCISNIFAEEKQNAIDPGEISSEPQDVVDLDVMDLSEETGLIELCDFSDPFSECSVKSRAKFCEYSLYHMYFYMGYVFQTQDLSICEKAQYPLVIMDLVSRVNLMDRILRGNCGKVDNAKLKKICLAFKRKSDKNLSGWQKDFYNGVISQNKELLMKVLPRVQEEFKEEYNVAVPWSGPRDIELPVELLMGQYLYVSGGKEAILEILPEVDFRAQIVFLSAFFSDEPLLRQKQASDVVYDLALLNLAVEEKAPKICKMIKNDLIRDECTRQLLMMPEKEEATEAKPAVISVEKDLQL